MVFLSIKLYRETNWTERYAFFKIFIKFLLKNVRLKEKEKRKNDGLVEQFPTEYRK